MATQKSSNSAKLLRERRTFQSTQLEAVIPSLIERVTIFEKQGRQHTLLESVSAGLYDELDKLAKKAAADLVTDLMLAQVNDVIRETKQLATEDAYVQRQNEFVPAGDNPEHRDALLVLRQIRQGLDRFAGTLEGNTKQAKELLNDARGIRVALLFFLQGTEEVSRSNIKHNGEDVSEKWLDSSDWSFSFTKLDRIEIPAYFSINQ